MSGRRGEPWPAEGAADGPLEYGETARCPRRIGYLFVSDWSHEFAGVAEGKVPSHRLFGAAELSKMGNVVVHPTWTARRRRLPHAIAWRLTQARWLLAERRRLDVVVATHEAAATSALILKRLGLLRKPVVVLTVAATWARSGSWGRVLRWSLRGADRLTVFDQRQIAPLARMLGLSEDRVRLLRLGVDIDFFRPQDVSRGDMVLSVGTNSGKDFPTLVHALPAGRTCLIVTDPANQAEANAVLTDQRVEFREAVPIVELRNLYARAEVVVIPLREVPFSSGQTVLLESLAMDTSVIISDVSAIRDYVSEQVVTLVPPGDAVALAAALAGRERKTSGRAHVMTTFTTAHMASSLSALLDEVAPG